VVPSSRSASKYLKEAKESAPRCLACESPQLGNDIPRVPTHDTGVPSRSLGGYVGGVDTREERAVQ
jgi:hypothetical protein